MKAKTEKIKLFKLRKETSLYKRDKLRCLTCEFNDGCLQRMCMSTLIFNWKLVEAESRILKQSSEQRKGQFSEPLRCLKLWECLITDASVHWFHQYNRHYSLYMITYG